MRNGKDRQTGCTLGKQCPFYHVKHCIDSLRNKKCFKSDCARVHLAGTLRRKPTEAGSRTHKTVSANNEQRSTYRRSDSNKRETRPASDPPKSAPASKMPPTRPTSKSSDFLELRDLLITFQDSVQRDMSHLKACVTAQEVKLAGLMIPPFPFQPPMQPSRMPMNWHPYPVPGC